MGSSGFNQMLHHVLDRWKLHHLLILYKKLLGQIPTCRLAASCPDEPPPVLGASTVGSEGVEVGTACGGTVATALGFLAALACRVAAGGVEELLLGACACGK